MANYQVVNGVKTLNMHGKNYVEVAERVTQVHEAKAEFDILKSEPMQVADRWLWVSVIKINGHQYMGNAEIKMNAPKNTPDGTNPFECAETSAIGRALGFAGFGSVESIASKDEIERGKPFSGAQEESKPAQAAPQPQANNEQGDPNRLQAEIKVQKRCRELFGDVKGMTTYNRLRAHVAEKFELGDVPEGCMTDEAIGEMWNQIRKLEQKQSLAKTA